MYSVDTFIKRWLGLEGGQERSNYSLFLTELCDIIGVPHPDPAGSSHELNDYVFERRLERRFDDGTGETKRIDLYRRGAFILEAKQSRLRGGKKAVSVGQGDLFVAAGDVDPPPGGTIDQLMNNARRQAEAYAALLPADHASPPFLLVCDVGRSIEVFADFSGYGRHYHQFPDARGFRLSLSQLADPATRNFLRSVWLDPGSLDPTKRSAKVTRQIAGELAEISKTLEARGFEARGVAVFLMRCLFTMFVEDAELIKKDSFKAILDLCLAEPRRFTHELTDLWHRMDVGDYSPAIGEKLLRFNGKLFKQAAALPLTHAEILLLRNAATADWRDLEPAIFGTLFEQALDPIERKQLGAHYTPRPYVDRVIDTTIMEPLTQDWVNAQNAAHRELRSGSKAGALQELVGYLKRLSDVRVLDPACGTGNFLYVALRRMKQLEGEVLRQIEDLAGDAALAEISEISVKPEQFYGLELNRRAVEIAELVLWIGYLQWHLRTRSTPPREPVLGSSDHVRDTNAVLTWDGAPDRPLKRSAMGELVVRHNRETYIYPRPSQPEWPTADFIVGNPPFIGGKDLRGRLDEGEADALWAAHPHMNPSADFVMYWWDHAAELLTRPNPRLRRFGLVTTNSITQVFQQRVVENRLKADPPISIVLAIPDHPWTKAGKDAAAVRIAITVAEVGRRDGLLRKVISANDLDTDEPKVELSRQRGRINADLTIGADVTSARPLLSNAALCSPGMKLHGDGFIVTGDRAEALGLSLRPGLDQHIREYRNGRDLTSRPRGVKVIDLFGLSAREVRERFPEVYQHLLEAVKPERDANNRPAYRKNWWSFGEPRRELRPALYGLGRYIATVETAKHRVFQFLPSEILPDNKLQVIAIDDALVLGVLSSRPHLVWALATGGKLGVGNDPVYVKSRCFDPFPFPRPNGMLQHEIAALAEELDGLRKLVLGTHSDLTLTTIYNVLEDLRVGRQLDAKGQDVKARGRVLIIKDLHDRIDAAVTQAYGWDAGIDDQAILVELVALNAQRAASERMGTYYWLRPEYQADKFGALAHRADRVQAINFGSPTRKIALPAELPLQAAEVLKLFPTETLPVAVDEIATHFAPGRANLAIVAEVLDSLATQGEIERQHDGRYVRAAR